MSICSQLLIALIVLKKETIDVCERVQSSSKNNFWYCDSSDSKSCNQEYLRENRLQQSTFIHVNYGRLANQEAPPRITLKD